MSGKVGIRPARPDDAEQIGQLIYDTVRNVNVKDYTLRQVEAWAPDPFIFGTYEESTAYVAEANGLIVGFGNITSGGYLGRFYVHRDFQRRRIGSLLLEALETRARALDLQEINAEVSVTAKPFFSAHGWRIDKKQTVVLRGVSFINYKMHKKLQ